MAMRRAAKTDANQSEIVRAFRAMGCTVEDLSKVGGGVPDILVGLRGRNFLVEIKTAKGTLNQVQVDWVNRWRGQVAVIRSIEEVSSFVNNVSSKR